MMKELDSLDFEIDFFERLVREHPDYVDALIPLAHAYTQKGDYEKGLAVDKRLARLCKRDPIVYYNLGCSYSRLNQRSRAMAALKKAILYGYEDFDYMGRDPDLTSLHDDPEFRKWTRRER